MLEMIWKPTLYGFDTCKEFAEAFRLNRDDLILSNAYIYEPYFGCMENLNCYVIFQEKYGAGEPTDVMVDAILADAAKTSCKRVIAIGGGTTAYVFAQHLLESQQSSGITILTNSIPVAELVQALESKDVEVIVTGGVTTRSNSLVGPIADKVVASLRVNTVFLGTHSVSIPRGFLMPNSLEAATDMALMDIADRTIILTDHTKWSCTSLSLFARFDQVDTVITDDGLDPDSVGKTRDLVKELVLAHQTEQMQESE